MRLIGMMSGTSVDAVDIAMIETDGETIRSIGPCGGRDMPASLRNQIFAATRMAQDRSLTAVGAAFPALERAIADFHADLASDFLARHDLRADDIDAVGFHGQTVLHRVRGLGEKGVTVQLGDAGWLADRLGLPVVHQLRKSDLDAGGQGAPLAPVYHAALARHSELSLPVAVLNLGGVANITFVGADGALVAFDTGPANGPIDEVAELNGFGRFDADGRLGLQGTVDEARISRWLDHPYFMDDKPKSLDRHEFSAGLVADLSPADGAATLAGFVGATVAAALRSAPEGTRQLIVCGGGRRNGAIMRQLRKRAGIDVLTAEDVGWSGDHVEAQAWAFLAARHLARLPISFPSTTGCPRPLCGGTLALPADLTRSSRKGQASAKRRGVLAAARSQS